MTYAPGKYEEKIISFDYDGTLGEDKNPEHNVAKESIKTISRLQQAGYRVVIHTSRSSLDTPRIAQEVSHTVSEIYTGKPIADLYLDDKGLLPRQDLIEAFIAQYFHTTESYLHKLTEGTLDDSYAQNIANVPENPEYTEKSDNSFLVCIPLTGGMDSTTLWQMGLESGLPLWPVYVNCGQEYAELELKVARKQASDAGYILTVINAPMAFKQYKHILLARNAVIIYTIADLMKQRQQWGELWFGNLSGESPILNGDKSRRFFNDTQTLLGLRGYDVRICNPLIGMDKPDEVIFWQARNIQKLIDTKSCFSSEFQQCGQCQTCFRKWVAFKAHGIEIRDTFANKAIETGFSDFIIKYKQVMEQAKAQNNYTHYSPERIKTTLAAIYELEHEN